MSLESALQRIRDFKLATGWSINRIAKAADLPESTIRRLMDPDWNPTLSTAKAVERVVDRHLALAVEQTSAPPRRKRSGGPVDGVAA